MNYKEIIAKIEELEITKEDFADDWDSERLDPIFGKSTEVDSHGGEGSGEEYWTVRYFEEHDVYVRLEGYYSSYEGTNFDDDDYEHVYPHQKTITVYSTSKTKIV